MEVLRGRSSGEDAYVSIGSQLDRIEGSVSATFCNVPQFDARPSCE
ncbi:MAG: hypothetical protein WBV82_31450 [Myxococcaceae bacterium]